MILLKKISFVALFALIASPLLSEDRIDFTFDGIRDFNLFINENDYKDTIRSSLFEQPEYQYITSLSAEQKFYLKYARRDRFPIISGQIINDESFERNIKDLSSVRKRRDDSFDATIEVNQQIYSGGSISAGIKAAKSKVESSINEQQKTVSDLILNANKIYLEAAKSSYILTYAENLLSVLLPYKIKVNDRVQAGIMDPIDRALFSVRLNSLETKIYQLKSNFEKDKNNYKSFFKKDFNKLAFPKIQIESLLSFDDNNSYEVEIAKLDFEEKKQAIKSTRSEYLPKLGVTARYTKYDIDDDSDEDDIRGGLYVTMPIFSFGRGAAKINAAKAAAEGSKNYIGIIKKDDQIEESSLISDYNNSISNRNSFFRSYNDTVNQRNTLLDRIEISGFAVNSLAEVFFSEISQLQILLDNESTILIRFLSVLHQNKQLNAEFRIKLD